MVVKKEKEYVSLIIIFILLILLFPNVFAFEITLVNNNWIKIEEIEEISNVRESNLFSSTRFRLVFINSSNFYDNYERFNDIIRINFAPERPANYYENKSNLSYYFACFGSYGSHNYDVATIDCDEENIIPVNVKSERYNDWYFYLNLSEFKYNYGNIVMRIDYDFPKYVKNKSPRKYIRFKTNCVPQNTYSQDKSICPESLDIERHIIIHGDISLNDYPHNAQIDPRLNDETFELDNYRITLRDFSTDVRDEQYKEIRIDYTDNNQVNKNVRRERVISFILGLIAGLIAGMITSYLINKNEIKKYLDKFYKFIRNKIIKKKK